MNDNKGFKISQYACAVLLIVSSIALVDFLKKWEYTDQLLTGSGWLHISWNPFSPPRHYIRIGYYK